MSVHVYNTKKDIKLWSFPNNGRWWCVCEFTEHNLLLKISQREFVSAVGHNSPKLQGE